MIRQDLCGGIIMPFNCDICGEECSYESLVLRLRNSKQEVIICDKHLSSIKADDVSDYCGHERPLRKVLCQMKNKHKGSHRAIVYWED
jgi:hypothetical protein